MHVSPTGEEEAANTKIFVPLLPNGIRAIALHLLDKLLKIIELLKCFFTHM
jgi:hypothetical protein